MTWVAKRTGIQDKLTAIHIAITTKYNLIRSFILFLFLIFDNQICTNGEIAGQERSTIPTLGGSERRRRERGNHGEEDSVGIGESR